MLFPPTLYDSEVIAISGRTYRMLQCDLLTLATFGLPFLPVQGEIEFEFILYRARTEFRQVRPTWAEYRRGRRYDRTDDPPRCAWLGGYAKLEPRSREPKLKAWRV